MKYWPKHEDGRNKKIGEMTAEERRKVFTDAVVRVAVEFDPEYVTTQRNG